MSKAKELYEKTQGLGKEERSQAIGNYAKEVGEDEFVKQLLEFADNTQQELKALSRDTIRHKSKWLDESWVNKSEISKRLYGKSDKTTVAYFTLQRQGKKPWKSGQLERLDEIRKELIESLKM